MVLEKKIKMWKVYRQTDRQAEGWTKDGKQVIRKAHLSFQLRWAKTGHQLVRQGVDNIFEGGGPRGLGPLKTLDYPDFVVLGLVRVLFMHNGFLKSYTCNCSRYMYIYNTWFLFIIVWWDLLTCMWALSLCGTQEEKSQKRQTAWEPASSQSSQLLKQ